MIQVSRILFSLVATVFLVACGGGGDAPAPAPAPKIDYYGVIVLEEYSGHAYIVTNNKNNTTDARLSAIIACGGFCKPVVEFGNGMCGALSRSGTTQGLLTYGWAVDSTKSAAEATAISQCKAGAGTNCVISLSGCNG